jgi:hypothetical protein
MNSDFFLQCACLLGRASRVLCHKNANAVVEHFRMAASGAIAQEAVQLVIVRCVLGGRQSRTVF